MEIGNVTLLNPAEEKLPFYPNRQEMVSRGQLLTDGISMLILLGE